MSQSYKFYKCKNCKHVQEIQTNHEGEVIDYCKNCSWKPSFGKYAVPFNGRTYRPFVIAKAKDLPKPRVGSCKRYRGDDWTWAQLSEWETGHCDILDVRDAIYVGTREMGAGKTWNVWGTTAGGKGASIDRYFAQTSRKRR